MKKNIPSSLKYKKYHKFKFYYGNSLERFSFRPSVDNTIALQALECGRLTPQQIEAGRKVIRRGLRKFSKNLRMNRLVIISGGITLRVFPSYSITDKPVAAPMGKGKGRPKYWVCPVKRGQIIYELNCPFYNFSVFLFLCRAGQKLPIKVKVVSFSY